MIVKTQTSGDRATTRPASGNLSVLMGISPALLIVAGLFGGGLLLGLLQGLGYFPMTGPQAFTMQHFSKVLTDPDFLGSLGLTFYIASTSTGIAVVISVGLALILMTLSERAHWFHFILQIPLVIPHLVVAIAILFLLAPAGFFSRLGQAAGMVSTASEFPLWVNDPFGIGIIVTYVWKEIPFITLMVFSVLRNTGQRLLEVGKTLHANRWQRFRYILLPIMFPSMLAASLIVFAYTFGAFEVPFLLGQTYPTLLPVWAYKHYADIDLMARPEGIAAGLIIAAIVAVSILVAHAVIWIARKRGGVI